MGYYRLIQLLVQEKRFNEAIAVYRQWIPLRPVPPIEGDVSFNTQPSSYLAELMVEKATFLREIGNLNEAVATYRLILKEFPDYQVSRDFPDMLIVQEDLESTAGIYRRWIQRDSSSGFSYLQLGFVLTCQGKKDEAIAAYEQAVQKGWKLPAAHFLGNLLLEQGKLEAAAKAYYKVLIEHDSSQSGGWLPDGMFQRYGSLLEQKKWREAITLYDELLKMKKS